MNKIQLNESLKKMAAPQEKAQCVSWFIETKSSLQTRRNFRTKYETDPSSFPSIRAWHKKFMETGTVFDEGRSERGEHRSSEKSSS